MSFPQFNLFPTEIHSLILASCLPNDEICLRLATKYLYNLPPSKPRPLSSKGISPLPMVSLRNQDRINQCSHGESPDHRWECHALLKLAYDQQRAITAGQDPDGMKMMEIPNQEQRKKFNYWGRERRFGPGIRGCNTREYRAHHHCNCFDFPLHKRLSAWMKNTNGGKHLLFCVECERFTMRKKAHQYRCFHGRPRCRQRPNQYLTLQTYRRGTFRRSYWSRRGADWKSGFNNSAMDRMESRLRGGMEERKGGKRYDMRKIVGKDVNTGNMRGGHSICFSFF
jgi:hypothetical protein